MAQLSRDNARLTQADEWQEIAEKRRAEHAQHVGTHARLIICKVRLWCPAWPALSEMRHRYPKCDTDVCLTSSGAGVSGNAQDAGEAFPGVPRTVAD
jgi:hypothetical protein